MFVILSEAKDLSEPTESKPSTYRGAEIKIKRRAKFLLVFSVTLCLCGEKALLS
jgi:hypothetical protein